jgi:hypothetical protein
MDAYGKGHTLSGPIVDKGVSSQLFLNMDKFFASERLRSSTYEGRAVARRVAFIV